MNEQVKASAKLAREFLQMITEGIGKLEGGAGEFARTGAAQLARRLPTKWSGGSSSGRMIATLLAAGVVASTAALIYSRTRAGQNAARSKRRRK